jgi:hypothetical protein
MRLALLLLLVATPAAADAWEDLAKCSKVGKRISITAMRAKDGSTQAGMPIHGLGYRGPTPEERCLGAAVAKLPFAPLSDEIELVVIGHAIGDPPPKLDGWPTFDATQRAALAACDRKSRTVRLVVDLRASKTRVWLPAWQFHSPKGDGSTPKPERRVKACMTKAIRGWTATLPAAAGEVQVALAPSS